MGHLVEINQKEFKMNNRTIALLAAAATSIALLASPALAEQSSTETSTKIFNHEEAAVLGALTSRGLHVSGVEEWGGLIRAFVVDADGSTTMQFFNKDNLTSAVSVQP
jgi:hypothetical protein